MTRWLTGLGVALRSLLRRTRVHDELDEELQYHLEREIERGINAGLAPDDARRAALRAMGAIGARKEEVRDQWSGNIIRDVTADLRYAARGLRRSPGFALLAIGIMALGIGANTAVFSVINAVLLKPLPYPGADRIVTLSTAELTEGWINPLVTIANYRDWRDQSASFEAMAAYRGGESPVSPGDRAEYGRVASVDAEFFDVFAVSPILGRTFDAGLDQRAVIISHNYWQTRYGGAPDILQRVVRAGPNPWPIVGVMPAGFHFPGTTDMWFPLNTSSTSRTSHSLLAVGRLAPGVTLAHAQTELTTIAARLAQEYPESNEGRGVATNSLQAELVGDVQGTLYLLWGVVAVVLLIACANTATLLLGKATTRTREIAVRAALGASRSRIVRQLVTESLLLAALAGAAGLVFAYWGAQALLALAPADVVRLSTVSVDGGVLVFTLAMSLVTSVLFGVVPALHASRVDLNDVVSRGGSRAVTGGRVVRTRGALVVTEIALAVVLMVGAGLLIKSLVALHHVDLGFQPENVLVMKATGVTSKPAHDAFFREVLAKAAALPGVTAVGATSVPPGELAQSGDGAYFIDRRPERRDRANEPNALFTIVTPGSFAALGIPIKDGRDFTDGDANDRPLVAIVNEALVRRSFAGENPIGRTIFCTFDRSEGMTIIGVVGDVRQRNPAIAPSPECYMPYTQHQYNGRTLHVVVRATGDPTGLIGPVRDLATQIAPQVPVSFTTMEATLSKGVADPMFRATLFGVFAALAVGLAMVGVYGVMAFTVEQRSKEIGLRMALGASTTSVMRLILGQGLVLAGLGLTLGLAVALLASRLLASLLFEVQPFDPAVYLGVVVLLGAITLVAGYLPARRAADMDAMVVLKAE